LDFAVFKSPLLPTKRNVRGKKNLINGFSEQEILFRSYFLRGISEKSIYLPNGQKGKRRVA